RHGLFVARAVVEAAGGPGEDRPVVHHRLAGGQGERHAGIERDRPGSVIRVAGGGGGSGDGGAAADSAGNGLQPVAGLPALPAGGRRAVRAVAPGTGGAGLPGALARVFRELVRAPVVDTPGLPRLTALASTLRARLPSCTTRRL